MCNGEFRDKSPDDALDYLDYIAENAQHWDIVGSYESSSKPQSSPFGGGMHNLREDHDFQVKFASLARKVKALESKKNDHVKSVQNISCYVCDSTDHYTQDSPTLPALRESLHEQVNVVDNFKRPNPNPYSQTYNFGWRNHPNFSWRNDNHAQPSQLVPPRQNFQNSQSYPSYVPPPRKTLEDILHSFIEKQESINNQTMQTLTNLTETISKLTSTLTIHEKGKFPAQPELNPKSQQHPQMGNSGNQNMSQVKSVITLRGGKVVEKHIVDSRETSKDSISENREESIEPLAHEEITNSPPVPSYAKFLKDLCTVKRKHKVQKRAFLAEQVSSILSTNNALKYKDPGCPTISCTIGDHKIGHALLDLGASINLLPYSVYQQLNLGEFKPISTTLLLANRLIKVPKEIIEDVLVQVDKFIYPVDFIVLESEPIANECKQIHVILDRPFLATANALINCRNGLMNLSFGNMTLELNVFNMCKQPHHQKDDDNENEEIDLIEPIIEEHIQDENFINSTEICFADSFESSKELDCDTANTCPTLDSMQVPIGDNDQSNFEDTVQPEEPNEEEAPELELKPLPEKLKYAYLGEQQTYPVVISCQLTHDQEALEDQEKTTFTCPFGTFAFRRMPFGLCNAPATFQSDYVVGAVLGQRKEGKPSVIYYASRTLNSAQMNYTTTEKELLTVIFALDKFCSYLIGSSTVVYSNHAAMRYLMSKQDAKPRLIRWILLLQEFNLTIKDKKGTENVVADHLSRLTNESSIETTPINDSFPDEFLFSINKMPWYANIVNYLATGSISKRNMMPLNPILIIEIFDRWGIDFMGLFPSSFGFVYILVAIDYVSKWIKVILCRHNDHKIVIPFLKENILSRFGIPRAIISDGAKVRLAGEFSDPFISYMPGFGKNTFAKKRRAKRLGSECSHCARLACKNPRCKALGMVSVNREDKIKLVKDGMSKESLDDILRSLEMHPSGYVQLYKKTGWEAYPRPIEGVQAVTRSITRGRSTSSSQLKNICVLSGFRYGKYKEFVQAAVDLDRGIAERKLHLVYRGGDRGLSKLVSEAAFVRGSQVLGIIPKAFRMSTRPTNWRRVSCLRNKDGIGIESGNKEELLEHN
ncbi:hypothetical protein KPL70_023432 [Citrus sinensis]|nr:hypothetical protein KPL70_023432 [Citrus sinensis]